MKLLSNLLFFALGFFVAWAVFVTATAIPSAEPACTGLPDCFLKSQTIIAALIALGAARLAYAGVLHTARATERHEERTDRRRRRTLGLTLSAEFFGIAKNLQSAVEMLRQWCIDQDDDITYSVLPSFRIAVPSSIDEAMKSVGDLGESVAPDVAATVGSLRAFITKFEGVIATEDPSTVLDVQSMQAIGRGQMGVIVECQLVADLLKAHAQSIETS